MFTERIREVKKKPILILFLLALLFVGALLQPFVAASMVLENGYDLSCWTVDGGGVTPNDNSGYTLGGTSGQPDAAIWSGGDYILAGGFWGGVAVEYRIYLPLVLRGT
jgi:hypothetical protein